MSEQSYILEIKKEYNKNDGRWLTLHFKMMIGLILFAVFVECLMAVLLQYMDLIQISMSVYLIKYAVTPIGLNVILAAAGLKTMKSSQINQKVKIYTISLLYVIICFVLLSIHSVFPALFLIFTIPIALTTAYGDYSLTLITGAWSILSVIVSELFVKWDPDKADIWNSNPGLANFIIAICVLGAFFAACIIVVRFIKEKNALCMQKELERYQLQHKLQIDELTAIHNRTALRNAFSRMEQDHAENDYIFVMIDLDNFKMINDTYGHSRGDHCLMEFGKILKENCGAGTPFRYGGDEFCILFQNIIVENVIEICKTIKKEFKDFIEKSDITLPVSASFGIANLEGGMSSSSLLINTDAALYFSKTKKDAIHVYKNEPTDA